MQGARSPEELDTLLEDASLLQDSEALVHLFEPEAVLAGDPNAREARGVHEISEALASIWETGSTYVAGSMRIIQAGSLALAMTETTLHVLRRGDDHRWRFAISLLQPPIESARPTA